MRGMGAMMVIIVDENSAGMIETLAAAMGATNAMMASAGASRRCHAGTGE
jgi:hypothetical protein